MPLPKIATPSYELELPSTGKTIQYRPFLVKEEKLLVIALESEDTKQITNAIKAVIRACILTKGVKVESLPTFDIEYLFLNIRGKSVGEDIDVNLICPDDNETEVSVSVNLDDIKVQKPEGHSNQIKLDNNLMMELKYPSLNEFIKNNFDPNDTSKNPMDQSFDLTASLRRSGDSEGLKLTLSGPWSQPLWSFNGRLDQLVDVPWMDPVVLHGRVRTPWRVNEQPQVRLQLCASSL